ncbi:MAG: PQQ-binding-like beta-propeller repeat protein [Chloroflexota bacterium]
MLSLRRLWIFGAVIVVGLLAAGCASVPIDSSWGDISLYGDNVLLAFTDRIIQVDPSDGSLVDLLSPDGEIRRDDEGKPRPWQVQVTGGSPVHFYSRPVELGDELVAASYEDKLYHIDPARAEASDPLTLPGTVVGSPLLTEDLLYLPLSNAGLVALDPNELTEAWHFTGDDGKGVWAQPLLQDGVLYVSSMNHFLFALDPQTGAELWRVDLEGAVASTPVFANGALYVGSFGHKLFKVTTEGSIASEFTTADWVWGAPSIVDNMVYVGDLGGNLYALNDTGSSFEQVWTRKVAGRAIRMTPLVVGDQIVVGSRDHFLYWINRETGEEVFKRELRGEVLSNLLLYEPDGSEPLVIVSTIAHEQILAAFTLVHGDPRWTYGL